MRKKQQWQKNRVESSCLLTDVNKASHKLSAKRAERQQQQTEAATSCNWQLASCGNSVWHATFCCCLDICNGAHKKIYIAFRRMRHRADIVDDGDDVDEAARHVGRAS